MKTTKNRLILFAPSIHTGGGTERVLVNLANALCKRNFKVQIAVNIIGNNEVYSLNKKINVNQYWFGKIRSTSENTFILKLINKLFGAFFLNYFLKKITNKKEDQIIISFSNGITIDCFKTKYSKNLIAFEHWPYWISDKFPKLQRKIKQIYPSLSNVIVLTQYEKNIYKSIGCQNVKVIPNAYSFWPKEPAKLENKNVLSIGHFNDQKRRDLLVLAWKNVHEKHPDWKLIVIGEGSKKEEVINLIKKLNIGSSVLIIPPTIKIVERYLQSSIYVMSSEYEALPMVLIEAKSCGIPCVSFDIISGPREIINNEIDGFIVPFPDTEFLAQRVNELIENEEKRREFGKEARLDASKRFVPDVVYTKWENLLKKLLVETL